MTTHIIEVTQLDIDHGLKEQCRRCPIALAIQHTLDMTFASVFPNVAYVRQTEGTFWDTALLPDIARDFILRFDNDQPVEPFSFELTFRGLND